MEGAKATASQRVQRFRDRQRVAGRREIRLFILDARSPQVRQRIADQVRRLRPQVEEEALAWIEAVNILDNVERDAPG